ncbi:MAG TPA: carbamoyltransferase C-terminal domain-containing protein [Pyrinomonadaceae bacterium]|nr:carbamoyltransferase C-terminal domain-containing protein [Pyrinomonadaceae bacterium]
MANNHSPLILGISASHNGAVCLLRGHELIVSVQEERLTRKKRRKIYGAQHSLALEYCLDYAGIKPQDLDLVVLTVTGKARSPMHDLKLNSFLRVQQNQIETLVIPHHLAHAVSAFATSGFEESAVLVVDGIGSTIEDLTAAEIAVLKEPISEGWETVSLYGAADTTINPIEKHATAGYDWFTLNGPAMAKFRSLGTIFSTAAEQIFGESLDAGKVMGLAPFGVADIPPEEFYELIDGRFVFSDKVPFRFQHRERWPLHEVEYGNLAASAQAALEKALLYLVNHLHDLHPSDNLCYAGGVALNSVANERLIRETPFKNIYIIPAAEDSGPAIGAAYYGLWQLVKKNERRKLIHDALGRKYGAVEISEAISETPGVEVVPTTDFISDTVELLCAGNSIGWFQGRSELGPRALGQRSIICDPRRVDAKDILNRKVKFREAFRPFAPAILLEESANWFEWEGFSAESPYMLRVAGFKEDKKHLTPAVMHVDGTGRVQTLTSEANGSFYDLVKRFHEKTGVPMLLNTSFNIMGMPIVETPQDALLCLLATGLDYCVLENVIVSKRERIFFDLNGFDSWQIVGQELLRLDDTRIAEPGSNNAIAGEFDLQSHTNRPAGADFAGIYQHPAGILIIEQGEHGLSGSFKGLASALERVKENTFVVSGELFNQSHLTFLPNPKGEIDRLSVLPSAGVEWAGFVLSKPVPTIFARVAGPKESDQEFFRKCAGNYESNGEMIRIALDAKGKFLITSPEQRVYQLVEGKYSVFHFKNTPGYSIEFQIDPAGGVSEAVLSQPNAKFRLLRK